MTLTRRMLFGLLAWAGLGEPGREARKVKWSRRQERLLRRMREIAVDMQEHYEKHGGFGGLDPAWYIAEKDWRFVSPLGRPRWTLFGFPIHKRTRYGKTRVVYRGARHVTAVEV